MSLIVAILMVTNVWASGTPVTFENAIEEIVGRSTGVKSKEAILEATRARNIPSKLYYVPSLSVTGKQTSTHDLLVPQDISERSVQGTASLNIYKFGADLAAYQAATADEEAQENIVANEILKSERDGITALVQQIQSQQEAEIISKIVKSQEDSLQTAKQRYNRGLLPQQEVDKLSIDLENSKASLIEVNLRQFEANANLVALLGHSNVRVNWPWKEKLSEGSFKPEAFDVSLRPDWKAAHAQVTGEEQRYNKNWGLIFPSLDASFSYGFYDYYTSPGRTGAAWSAGLTLSIPLFDRLTNYSTARTQLYARVAAEQQLEQVQRTAKSEWESSRASFETALQSAVSREKVLSLSRRLYQDNLRRFQSGRINANEFILDQQRLFSSEKNVVLGWAAVHLAYTRLCHALGRRVASCRQ
jgi:outer membrane protein TolC